jgi:hypothetical protein
MRISHIVAAILAILVAASSAAAQTEYGPLFHVLAKNQTVVIVDQDGHKQRGRVEWTSADRVKLATRRGDVEVLYNRIMKVDRPSNGFRDGALLGASAAVTIGMIGLAAGDTACRAYACERNSKWSWPWAIGGSAAFGAVVGAAIDAATRHKRVIYRRPSGVKTTIRPAVGQDVRGAVVSVSW